MALSNAERQQRWRAKRSELARLGKRARNWPLDIIVADRLKRGNVGTKERRLAVQRLVRSADREEDAELLAWLRSNIRTKIK